MTFGEVVDLCGTPSKTWYYSNCRTYNARMKAKACRNKYGVFYFSDNSLIAFIPTHRLCPSWYRNHLYISRNRHGTGIMGRHLNLINKDTDARMAPSRFLDIFNISIRDLTTSS